jgi:hypothetical protein
MIKVTNISSMSVEIGGVIIKPRKSYIFPDNLPDDMMAEINNLSNLGLVRVVVIKETPNVEENNEETAETTSGSRKSNKKNK